MRSSESDAMSATARRGWRVPVVAFITGVFIATAVLTRDYTVGDDVLAPGRRGKLNPKLTGRIQSILTNDCWVVFTRSYSPSSKRKCR